MQTTPAPARTEPSAAAPTPGAEHSAAIDALTAAKLRREFARDGSSVFVHAPRPACAPGAAERAWLRTFGPDNHSAACGLKLQDRGAGQASITALRPSITDVACLTLELETGAASRAWLIPAELRELAARLIDAAHDIEQHPAAALAAQQGGAA